MPPYTSDDSKREVRELKTLLATKLLDGVVEVIICENDGGGQPVLKFTPEDIGASGGKDEVRSAIENCEVGDLTSLMRNCIDNETFYYM